jgi:glycosyltransferase involved in cell wall biosynthesis
VTSSLHEGFCIPVIEALACGKPVVGAHATALPETIGSGGLTFQPLDPADLARQILIVLDSTGDRALFEEQGTAGAGSSVQNLTH